MSSKKITIFFLCILIIQISFLGNLSNASVKSTNTTSIENVIGATQSTSTKINQESIKKVNSFNSSAINIENGYARDGSNFSRAINLQENQSMTGLVNSTNNIAYYRYYAQYPYEYVNITVTANSPGLNVSLVDQFNSSITSNISTTLTNTIIITSSNSTLHNDLRFIGWYYIIISTSSSSFSYQIQIHFLKGDGSSLWSPIEIQPGVNAWNGIFHTKENSEVRNSTFYAFYVNLSDPWIDFSLSNFAYVWLYGPQMNFLTIFPSHGSWLATQEGSYYLEVNGQGLTDSYVSISLSLSKTNQTLGYSINQPLEIPRNTGLQDNILKLNSYRYLKLYLFIGENVSINIGDTSGSNYDVGVYAPWGKGDTIYNYVNWFETTSSYTKHPINLFNVENSGYYIFRISGPVGSYSVHLSFKYQVQEGTSWESAKIVHLDNIFQDHHYLFTNGSYYYKIYFAKGNLLNISLHSESINDAIILGKYRQEIGYMDLSSGQNFIVLPNITESNYIYIQLNPSTNTSNFSLKISKTTQIISPTIHVDGTLVTFNRTHLKTESVPLIKITLIQQINSKNYILGVTSTNEFGYFSLIYSKSLSALSNSSKFFLQVEFDSPALQLMNYNAPTPNEVYASVYTFTIPLNTSLLPYVHLGQIYVPSSDFELAHIFLTVTKGWLWVFNLGIETIPPQQIHVLYSAESPGTAYSPFAIINNKIVKYVINLLGTNTGDDDGWDNTVILHEYGHHVEETYDLQNNPGGSHYYSSTISPDLAHAEGFPTFFASVVLNTSIYQDTSSKGIDGINLETGRMITNNQLEDLFGMYGETSVFILYYDLIDKSNKDDVNFTEFGDSVTIPVQDFFNILFNYRKANGSGVTTTNDVYQGLIQEFPNLIDNISKSFYAHGNSYYSYPFMVGNTDKIVSASDTNANFTWELYDSNPQSYQVVVDGSVIKTGVWNFTEEVLLLNIHQFNFTAGTTHYFVLKLNDTLNNQRIYTFEVKIVTSMSLLGSNYLNSINVINSKPISLYPLNTTYFQYIPTESGIINITYNSPGYNVTVYDQNNKSLSFYNQTSSFIQFTLEVVKGQVMYLVFAYISGSNNISLVIDPSPVGYSPQNPLQINSIPFTSRSITSSSSTYYLSFTPTYSGRLFSISLAQTNIRSISIYYYNMSLLGNFSITGKEINFSHVLPLDTAISNTVTYNPFKSYLILLTSNDTNFTTFITTQSVQIPKIQFLGPITQILNTNQSLELNYTGSLIQSFNILLNNTNYLLNWTIQSEQNGVYSIALSTLSLSPGFYVADIAVVDVNGLQLYYQFSFTISSKLTSQTSVNSNNYSLLLLIEEIFIPILILGVVVSITIIQYNRTHERILSQKIVKILHRNKKY